MVVDTPARTRSLAVFAECLAGGWLAEISADLREAVASAGLTHKHTTRTRRAPSGKAAPSKSG